MKQLACLRMCPVPKQKRLAMGIVLMLAVFSGINQYAAGQAAQAVSPPNASEWQSGHTIVNPPARFDHSAPLPELLKVYHIPPRPNRRHSTTAPVAEPVPTPPAATIGPEAAAVEQVTQGVRPAATAVASFEGLGVGYEGPQGKYQARNPSDNSLGVGRDEIVQIVNSRLAIFTKKGTRYAETGKALLGPVVTNTLFAGFGGPCENQVSGDVVVRYDQLADRWLFVVPIFRRSSDQPNASYGMCYAISASADPMGTYYRYEFNRPLFPDYPRPAVWPNGYYVTTSTGDTVIQKHVCAADRSKMLQGLSANEQCEVIDGVSFLNPADLDGRHLPPMGMPEILMAAGGSQLHHIFEDNVIYVWKFAVNWNDPQQTKLTGPERIDVAPYHFLCDGQLTKCVPQPGTDVHLDAQGDKLMQRLVYRNFSRYQSIVASQSVDTKAGGGGVRWYEFRLDAAGSPQLFQQGTYAPDGSFRWLPSIAMDRKGDIGVGYSFGDTSNYPGQRFAARFAAAPKGQMSLQEAVMAEGKASQTNTIRWEDFTTLDIDPSDDCTFWYVGDYLEKGHADYSTRISGYRLPGCVKRHKVLGLF